jgi:hypothetical protein
MQRAVTQTFLFFRFLFSSNARVVLLCSLRSCSATCVMTQVHLELARQIFKVHLELVRWTDRAWRALNHVCE